MKDSGIASKFLGMEIEYDKDGSIKIHQNQYIRQLLERHGMDDCSPVTTPMDTSVKLAAINASTEAAADPSEYASIVGGLMLAACVTRPDIMCAVGQLSQFLNNPSSKHLLAAKRVLRYLQGTSNYGITLRTVLYLSVSKDIRMQIGLATSTLGDQRRGTLSCSTTEQLRGKVDVILRWHCRLWSRSTWLSQRPRRN